VGGGLLHTAGMDGRVAIGPFAFDPASGVLSRDGAPVPLAGRARAVLAALAEAGGTATKEAILDRAWPGVTVEESNLTVQIAALRKILGDDAIVTVPRVGYRLRLHGSPAAAELPKVAVVPFALLGDGPQDSYFADGIAEDLIAALGRFRQFVVLSRQAAAAQAQALAASGVRYGVTGTLRRSGDRLRVSAHLVETGTGRQLWAHRMEGALDDLFAFQDQIAEAVTAAIAPEIEAAEIAGARRDRPASMAAYDLYLQALPEIYAETDEGNVRAAELLDRALAIEPGNGLYLAHLAWVLEHRHTMALPSLAPGDRQRAVDCARAALGGAAGDARILCHAAATLFIAGNEFDLGVAVIERALAENPNNTMVLANAGVVLTLHGQFDRAESILLRCLEIGQRDPMAHIPWCALSAISLARGDLLLSVERAMRAHASNPVFDPGHWMLLAALGHLGRVDQAAAALARYRALRPEMTIARVVANDPPSPFTTALAEGLRLAGLPPG
jgi:TolB-like protein